MASRKKVSFRNIVVVLVVIGIVAAGALYISTGSGNQKIGSAPGGSGPCAVPSLHVDANFTLGNEFSTFLSGIAYDSQNNLLYVSSPSTESIYAVNPAENSIVANMTGTSAGELAFDPTNGYIYAVNSLSNYISVINTSSRSTVTVINVGERPSQLAYDPANSEMYVSITGSVSADSITGSGVVAISSSTNRVVANISSGAYPSQMAYDSMDHAMYVTQEAGNNETIINSTTNAFAGIVFFPNPSYVASLVTYDPANGNLYFGSYGNNTIVEVEGAANPRPSSGILNSIVGNASIPYDPSALAYDPANKTVWAGTNATAGLLSIISSSNNAVSTTHLRFIPTAFAYDSMNQEMYVISIPNEVLALSYGCR